MLSQRIAVFAILLAASAVPAFDYAITRVGDDVRTGRLESFDTITAGTAPSPYRYRVLVPYTIAPLVALGERLWPRPSQHSSCRSIYSCTTGIRQRLRWSAHSLSPLPCRSPCAIISILRTR